MNCILNGLAHDLKRTARTCGKPQMDVNKVRWEDRRTDGQTGSWRMIIDCLCGKSLTRIRNRKTCAIIIDSSERLSLAIERTPGRESAYREQSCPPTTLCPSLSFSPAMSLVLACPATAAAVYDRKATSQQGLLTWFTFNQWELPIAHVHPKREI